MGTRSYSQIEPGSTGNKLASQYLTDGASQVHRQELLITDPDVIAGVARVLAADPDPAVDYGLVVRTILPAITKGVQGARGVTVQALKDAGRAAVVFYATAIAVPATATEGMITLNRTQADGATSTSGTSFVITNGKRFRISNITLSSRANATGTAHETNIRIRVNAAGTASVGSTAPFSQRLSASATVHSVDRISIPIADGLELVGDGTRQFGMSMISTYVTNPPTLDAMLIGYEY